jgi:hypothetical protein
MWTQHCEQMTGSGGLRFAIRRDSAAVTYAVVLDRWQHDGEFRAWFNALLAEVPYSAFRWETPPVTIATVGRPFEFVIMDSPSLARRPDSIAFAEHFKGGPSSGVVEFTNLGKDAIMVVPCPCGEPDAYVHLAAFVREAPDEQRHALWQLVGAAMMRRLGTTPVWLSTAGAGVAWLHVRLDDRPKYYGHRPYREAVTSA